MKKTRQRLLALLIAVVVGLGMLNVLAYNHAYAMMHFASGGSRTGRPEDLSLVAKLKVLFLGVNVPRPVSDRSPSDLSPDCQVLSIASGMA